MVFIDNLAYSLLAVSFAGFLSLYMLSSAYRAYKKKPGNASACLKSACVPLGIVSAYLILTGLWGQFAWPLPGSYNILFYDPMLSIGIVLLSFAIAVKYDLKLEYSGFLGMMVGEVAIVYGAEGYLLGLTSKPLALLIMYALYGLAGVFSYPVSLMFDRLASSHEKVSPRWKAVFIVFCILLLLASMTSTLVGIVAVPQHLMSAP
jgi:putative membrane protein